ncbi:MAG: hypothetical protein ACJAS4_002461 [Bacteriovoracaceae bacterium]|jgi:hypothetical protein
MKTLIFTVLLLSASLPLIASDNKQVHQIQKHYDQLQEQRVFINQDARESYLATELKFCSDEEELREFMSSMNVENNLGCKAAIDDARKYLSTETILAIIDSHLEDLNYINEFEEIAKTEVSYINLVPSILVLRDRGITLNLLKRNTHLNEDIILKIELGFEETKSELSRAMDDL